MALEVLVVDDEADIRDLVAGVLEDEGYTVRTAADSDSALARRAVAEQRPHDRRRDERAGGRGQDEHADGPGQQGAGRPRRRGAVTDRHRAGEHRDEEGGQRPAGDQLEDDVGDGVGGGVDVWAVGCGGVLGH